MCVFCRIDVLPHGSPGPPQVSISQITMRSKFHSTTRGKHSTSPAATHSQGFATKIAVNEDDASRPPEKSVSDLVLTWTITALQAKLTTQPLLATGQSGNAAAISRDIGNISVNDAPVAVSTSSHLHEVVLPVVPMHSVADKLLRDSHQRLHRAMKAAKLTYIELDYSAKQILRPENFVDVMGFALLPDNVTDIETGSQRFIAHVVPGDRQRIGVALEHFLAGQSTGPIEYSVVGDDGKIRHIESTWSIEAGVDGQPVKAFVTYMDISERAHAQAATREADARHRSLFTSIDQGACIIEIIFDADGKPVDYCFIEVNPSFEKQSGLLNATGKRVRELLPTLEAYWWELYGKVALTGESVRFVQKIQALGDRWLDVFAFRLGGPGSHQVAVTFTDITQHKRAEDAQRISEEMFRATFEQAALGISQIGLDRRFMRVNHAYCRLIGYSAEELTGMTIMDITHPDDVPASLAKILLLKSGDIDTFTLEKRLIHKTGRYVTVNLTVSLLRDTAGLPRYIIAVVEDISERSAMLAELERKTIFAERLTHIMPNTLHVFDLASKRNLWVNRHVGSMLGYSTHDIEQMGSRFMQLTLHPDDVAPLAAHFDRVGASSDNEVLDIEFRMCNHEGEWRWLHQTDIVFRRNIAGLVTELVGTATDVTERRRSKADLSTALLIAEAANHAKSDFLSRMSHELRSPLNAVLGYAQLLESGTPKLVPIQRESIEHILKAGWYLLELINEILDLAMIESGNLSFTPEDVPLAGLLNDCHAMVELQAQKCGVCVTFPSAVGPCLVRGDRTRLQQIFVNLLSNAVKYNRPGGVVRVKCAVQAPGIIRISFEDSGTGLTPEQLRHLFQPFERLGQEAGMIEGTGIGLMVSKRLVELMGGQIGAQSTVGVGSVFWVDLLAVDSRPADDTLTPPEKFTARHPVQVERS